MKGIDEGTRKMMDAYCKLHFEEGKTPKEIARKFRLSYTCVLAHLDEIAMENGCTRAELLEAPNRSGERLRYCGRLKTAEPLDLSQLKEDTAKTIDDIGKMVKSVDEILKKERGEKNE
ncbi:MAG: hypothetical protein K6G36_02320 [Candidatus Saccharibacteria bacterium]|nr:hypothetical protein [Candidatus Saccharibacteria bacterium]